MRTTKQLFLTSTLMVLLAAMATAQGVEATIDATHTGQPITKLMFGGFMEPATTGVWSETLSDRKFFNEITSNPAPATGRGGFGMRGPARRWMPVDGPPATMAEQSLPEAPRRVTLPAASISVYEFAVR